jgi:hypothetical protein
MEVNIMATSSFYENVYIDDKSADILIEGLKAPKAPRPLSCKAEIERGNELLKQFRSHLEQRSAAPKNRQ